MTIDGTAINAALSFVTAAPLHYPGVISLDGQTIGAFLGFLGILASTIGGVYIATGNRRSEKASVAIQTLEATRDKATEERFLLRDEKIANMKEQLEECRAEAHAREAELEAEIDKLEIENERLRKGPETHDG